MLEHIISIVLSNRNSAPLLDLVELLGDVGRVAAGEELIHLQPVGRAAVRQQGDGSCSRPSGAGSGATVGQVFSFKVQSREVSVRKASTMMSHIGRMC